ncbi:hypothetical protein [Lactiplantibacillus fabifermentans]|uniref:Uncharacterized protein n=2 Tax=Lactiplantibacillus fabifermentans TaxID=483011 RepID=A0A0R2P3N3_9LACO|nr:hypothetical protein [Lactiplantibacillus fabifermentans]ETY72455.1 hypothetical protein LFAB_17500 [Lactiplantibacillus fabifermentans T30PCM01]KRO29514.1 hypothetical protein DY78_GL002902 [Lactiplantibacillus fabifermentans DSM 21115]
MANEHEDDCNLSLDRRKFAEMVVSSHQVSDELDPEAIVKRKLTLYLSAYYMADRFNKLEDAHFQGGMSSAHYQKLLNELKDEKFGDW